MVCWYPGVPRSCRILNTNSIMHAGRVALTSGYVGVASEFLLIAHISIIKGQLPIPPFQYRHQINRPPKSPRYRQTLNPQKQLPQASMEPQEGPCKRYCPPGETLSGSLLDYGIPMGNATQALCTCVRMYLCVYVCTYVCMRACMVGCLYLCMHACMHVCMYVCMYVRMYVCMYLSVYVCMYVRM